MDLGAYAQIEDLGEVAKKNGIVVPRLRGYRLMRDEEPVSLKYTEEEMSALEVRCARELITAAPFWSTNPTCWTYDDYTDLLCDYYLIKGKEPNEYGNRPYVAVNWSRIHGKKRKILKTEIHNQKRRALKQMEMFNKYAGRDDVLYVHARIGGGNWSTYYMDVVGKPWFIDKVDDSFDDTYCDIYARINPVTTKGDTE